MGKEKQIPKSNTNYRMIEPAAPGKAQRTEGKFSERQNGNPHTGVFICMSIYMMCGPVTSGWRNKANGDRVRGQKKQSSYGRE